MNTNSTRAHVLHGLKVGLLVSVPAAVLIFALCCWANTSVAHSFRPWWRWSNWQSALIIGVPLFVIFGIAGTLKARLDVDDNEE